MKSSPLTPSSLNCRNETTPFPLITSCISIHSHVDSLPWLSPHVDLQISTLNPSTSIQSSALLSARHQPPSCFSPNSDSAPPFTNVNRWLSIPTLSHITTALYHSLCIAPLHHCTVMSVPYLGNFLASHFLRILLIYPSYSATSKIYPHYKFFLVKGSLEIKSKGHLFYSFAYIEQIYWN